MDVFALQEIQWLINTGTALRVSGKWNSYQISNALSLYKYFHVYTQRGTNKAYQSYQVQS